MVNFLNSTIHRVRLSGTDKIKNYTTNWKRQHRLTKIIDCESLKNAESVAKKERALIIGDSDNQRAAQSYHEVGHRQAEDNNVHGTEERRILHQDSDCETVVEHR